MQLKPSNAEAFSKNSLIAPSGNRSNRSFRIMFVASDNSATSGAFRSMTALAALLKNTFHHKVLVVLPKAEGTGKELLDAQGIENVVVSSYPWIRKITFLSSLKSYCKWPLKRIYNNNASKHIEKLIKENDIDIVHINTSWSYVGAPAALKAHTPLVWHIREFLEEDQHVSIVHRNWGYALMKQATRLVAISESIHRKYVPIVGADKVLIIKNGVDDGIFNLSGRQILGNDCINLLMVGGIGETKRQYQAVQACLTLHKKGVTNITLRLVGKGNKKQLARLKEVVANANAADYILFCGPSDDTVSFYRQADIYLMCSRAEAFGRVTVEAMMGGCLVIGANSGATAELIEDGKTGYLYESGNAADLADRIEYAITHKEESQKLAKAGQAYALNNMTAERNAEQIDALYRQIMTSGGGSSLN